MPRYSAFGLEIDSQLEVPWLLPGTSRTADVEIRLGPVPTSLPDPLGKGGYFEASHDTFLFNQRDLARYLVKEGREIDVLEDTLAALEERVAALEAAPPGGVVLPMDVRISEISDSP